jgi:succinyl-diaminopimelate desuccinylase
MDLQIDDRALVALLRDLVAIPSVNPDMEAGSAGEGAVGDWMADWGRGEGFAVQVQPVAPGRNNVLVDLGLQDLPTLALVTHLDTVPHGDLTPRARAIAEEDGRVYGRGACDAKASLAAMLMALRVLRRQQDRLRVNVQVAAMVDEEQTFHGVLEYVARLTPATRPVAAIVGEPTLLQVVIAHMGVLRFHLVTHGLAAHSSRPTNGVNAIDKMAELNLALRDTFARDAPPPHPLAGEAALTFAEIAGGTAPNVVPDRCTAVIDRRLLPGEGSQPVLDWFDAQIARLHAADPALRVERGEPFVRDDGLETAADAPIVHVALAAREAVLGAASPIGVPFGTDGSKLGRAGIPTIVVGPGNIAQAHTVDEWVAVEQLVQATQIYARCALLL